MPTVTVEIRFPRSAICPTCESRRPMHNGYCKNCGRQVCVKPRPFLKTTPDHKAKSIRKVRRSSEYKTPTQFRKLLADIAALTEHMGGYEPVPDVIAIALGFPVETIREALAIRKGEAVNG